MYRVYFNILIAVISIINVVAFINTRPAAVISVLTAGICVIAASVELQKIYNMSRKKLVLISNHNGKRKHKYHV